MLQKLAGHEKFHFVGIGGSGMSAIAKILLEMGYKISGSDAKLSETTKRLENLGAIVFCGHDASYIRGADAIVVSSAIPRHNPEVVAAQEKNLPIFHRSDILAALMDGKTSIAVAGSHGKTTTTSMIAVILERAGLDPTVLIGGDLDLFSGNAKLGKSKFLVAEADESDGSFLKFSPQIAVVTNIENDHLDHFGSMAGLLAAFETFMRLVPKHEGMCVLCADNKSLCEISSSIDRPILTYGLEISADYKADEIVTQNGETAFLCNFRNQILGRIILRVPGQHNIANALAAVAVARHLGVDFSIISSALAEFKGAKRRFQTKGQINGVWIVDDYAHHPTEIRATIAAALTTKPSRLVCVFQPHRYTRTKLLRHDFGTAFRGSDILILTDIYPAGEPPIPGITGQVIQEEVESQTGQQVKYIASMGQIADYLASIVQPGDMVLTMGAGNIHVVGEELVRIMENENRT